MLRQNLWSRSLLDVGCGRGLPVKMLKGYKKVGVDISISSLTNCLQEKTHHNVVLADASHLPFRDKSFDIALCLQVLHLLKKRDAMKVLDELERIACRQIILAVPKGPPPEGAKAEAAWKSTWEPLELVKRGYRVEYFGFRFLHRSALRRAGTFCSKFLFAIDPFISIIGKLVPKLMDQYMVCHKMLTFHKR